MVTDLTRQRRPLWIVKLGGSLAESDLLKSWVALLASTAGSAVIVPGGGPFADQVRITQKQCGFDDATAHYMALLAMEQFGRMLMGLDSRLTAVRSRTEIGRVCRAGGVPVWMPTRMVLGRPEIPESWDITSDSLAAWLAGALGGRKLLLVKSVDVTNETATAKDLARRGIVDPAFPTFLARSRSEAWCIGAARHREMAAVLTHGGTAGTRITVPDDAGPAIAGQRRRATIDVDTSRARQR